LPKGGNAARNRTIARPGRRCARLTRRTRAPRAALLAPRAAAGGAIDPIETDVIRLHLQRQHLAAPTGSAEPSKPGLAGWLGPRRIGGPCRDSVTLTER